MCVDFLQEERVLFHYNGHGVPKPTINGEIWVFNKVGCENKPKKKKAVSAFNAY
jgi:hypothetical protein